VNVLNFKPSLFDKAKSEHIRIIHDERDAVNKVGRSLFHLIPPALSARPIIFVCIGTDRSTGDSLGPLIGTFLEQKNVHPFHIYGTLDQPIHALNLTEKLLEIKHSHPNPFIIGIDACLGRLKSVGVIQIGNGPIKPGAGVNKELPAVGDIHISGIVNVSGFMEYYVLQNTRLNLVMKMAKTVADGIYEASMYYKPKHHFSELQWTLEHEKTN
jgi:putative sporulation protein YyaC